MFVEGRKIFQHSHCENNKNVVLTLLPDFLRRSVASPVRDRSIDRAFLFLHFKYTSRLSYASQPNCAMEKYRLIQEHKVDFEQPYEGRSQPAEGVFPEVRITQQGKPRNYISYAMNLFVSCLYPYSLLMATKKYCALSSNSQVSILSALRRMDRRP